MQMTSNHHVAVIDGVIVAAGSSKAMQKIAKAARAEGRNAFFGRTMNADKQIGQEWPKAA